VIESEISVTQLHNQIKNDPEMIVLYTSMKNMSASKPDIVRQHPDTYIPSSRFFDFQTVIADVTSRLTTTMPSIDVFEREVQCLGINLNSQIVVYDDFGNFCASRVWFMFKSMGHSNIKVLQGGLAAWISKNYETESSLFELSALGDFIAKPDRNYQFVDKDFIANHVVNETKQIMPLFDARSRARFSGEENETNPDLRSGHIPNAKNIHYPLLQDDSGAYLPADQLQDVFEQAKQSITIGESPMAFSCGSGVTACILAQAADALGAKPLYVYDGSWSDWGSQHHLPISTGV
jgi:thiosulfate/3-mercaptopyruvate sulfurtransferase